jgi:hypothetical protein
MLDEVQLRLAQIVAPLVEPVSCLSQHAAAQESALIGWISGPCLFIRLDLPRPGLEDAIAVDPAGKFWPVAYQGLGLHVR